MDAEFVRGLRARGVDVLTAATADMIRKDDEEHLAFAHSQGRALYSFNIADYHEIHTEWISSGRMHSGIILAQQKRYSIGEQIRRLVHLMACVTDDEMRNREEFLSGW
jgi:hypothetical protein